MGSLGRLVGHRERKALKEMDDHAVGFWADDPDVEIQVVGSDPNPAHGKNSRRALNWLAQPEGH